MKPGEKQVHEASEGKGWAFAASSAVTGEAILPWLLGSEGGLYLLGRSFHFTMFPRKDYACLHTRNSV